jgi:hypothetical protein
MPTYRANWRLRGLKGIKALEPGQTIQLTALEAARFVARGVLSLCAGSADEAPTPAAVVPVAPPQAAAVPVAAPAVDLSAMSKGQLVDYARTHLHLRLDVTKSKTDLLAAIVKAAGK